MSGAAKMRRTEVTIKQGHEVTQFRFPFEAGLGLLEFLRALQGPSTDLIPVEEAFPQMKDPSKRIGIIFRGIRFKNHLTQAEVAQKLGLEQSDISKIEKGKRPIGKALAKKIEKAFGIDYRRFL